MKRSGASTWFIVIGIVLPLFICCVFVARVMIAPWSPTRIRCERQRSSGRMHWNQVCANPQERIEQEIDHCPKYRRDKDMWVWWCTSTTVLSEATIERIFGADASLSFFINVILPTTLFIFAATAGCCAALQCLRRRLDDYELPSTRQPPQISSAPTYIVQPSSAPMMQLHHRAPHQITNDDHYQQQQHRYYSIEAPQLAS